MRVQVHDAVAHQHADAVIIIHPPGTAGHSGWHRHLLLLGALHMIPPVRIHVRELVV